MKKNKNKSRKKEVFMFQCSNFVDEQEMIEVEKRIKKSIDEGVLVIDNSIQFLGKIVRKVEK